MTICSTSQCEELVNIGCTLAVLGAVVLGALAYAAVGIWSGRNTDWISCHGREV
jgi:hypothetical protein